MNRPRPLADYPPATLDTVSGIITTLLLGYQDMLPTDLYVKLDLFRGDLANAISPSPRLPAIRPRIPPPPGHWPVPVPGTITRPVGRHNR